MSGVTTHTFQMTDESGDTVILSEDSDSPFALIRTGGGAAVALDVGDVERLREALYGVTVRLRRQPVQDGTP